MNKNSGIDGILDERQKSIYQKYGMNAFSMINFIILINAIIKQQFLGYNYATPINECIILMFIPFTYLSVASTLKNSYVSFSNNRKLNTFILIDLLVTSLFMIGFMVYKSGFSDILKSGLYSDWTGCLLFCIYSFILLLAHLVRLHKNKREENENWYVYKFGKREFKFKNSN